MDISLGNPAAVVAPDGLFGGYLRPAFAGMEKNQAKSPGAIGGAPGLAREEHPRA